MIEDLNDQNQKQSEPQNLIIQNRKSTKMLDTLGITIEKMFFQLSFKVLNTVDLTQFNGIFRI